METARYFDQLYQQTTDPWHYETRWYEARKRQLCLAALTQPRYQHALELGCANGVFSEQLSARCRQLHCIDGNEKAVQAAQHRLAHLPHVSVSQGFIPNALPDQQFDLIVMGEILYYLTAEHMQQVVQWVKSHLLPGGTVICCHWRYPIVGFELDGDRVHHQLQFTFEAWLHHLHLVDSDFNLDVWLDSEQTVAMTEQLVD